jgi:hypothetical protein
MPGLDLSPHEDLGLLISISQLPLPKVFIDVFHALESRYSN